MHAAWAGDGVEDPPPLAALCGGAAFSGKASPDREPVEFCWNLRRCRGISFHRSALEGEAVEVAQALKRDPSLCGERFRYETRFQGAAQEGSGEAIHLAASRGHQEVVSLLRGAGASFDACVTRDGQNHYDVLHAAVFAEGKGGEEGFIHWLIRAGAPLSPNLDNKWPLHLAFQTGAVSVLPILRKAARDQGINPHEAGNPLCPLLEGIRAGHMSERQLSIAASPTPLSLRTFIDHEPRCVRGFMARLRQDSFNAKKLAEHVHGEDIGKVLRECPDAACALLQGLTAQPLSENPGLHPLPQRVSFAPRSRLERLRHRLNRVEYLKAFCEPATEWKYDGTAFEAPEWHNLIGGRSWGKPFLDADVRVCFVPNLICASFFGALVAASGGCNADRRSLRIFREPIVRAAISYAWWNGSCRLDLLHVGFSIWGLLLLIYDTRLGHSRTSIAVSFVGTLGMVDFAAGLVRVAGWVKMNGPLRDLFTQDVAWDLLRCIIPLMLLIEPTRPEVNIMVILLYWWQLLGVFTFSEHIASSILPITRLARGLVPAWLVAFLGLCGFTHAFQVVRSDGNSNWMQNFFSTFSTLFTESLPKLSHTSGLELLMCYFAVSVFSIFFVNIIIGAVIEQYNKQQLVSVETLRLIRATKNRNFLASARLLPGTLTSKRTASRIASFACVVAVTMQLLGLYRGAPLPWTRSVLAVCQSVMMLAAFQDPTAHWVKYCSKIGCGSTSAWRYLWIVQAKEIKDIVWDEADGASEAEAAAHKEDAAADTLLHAW